MNVKQTPQSAGMAQLTIANQCLDVIYPQVFNLPDASVQSKINSSIKQQVDFLIPPGGCEVYATIYGRYKTTLNEKGLLSVVLQFYTFRHHAANGLNGQGSVTVDLAHGQLYQLYQLFKRDSNYRMALNKIIRAQIKEKDLHLVKEFTGINDYQHYYLTDRDLVIYFDELEYTIHADGIPEFFIPYVKIRNLIDPQGPLGRLIS